MTAIEPAPARIGIAGTTVAHGTLLALALFAARRTKAPPSTVYEVNLVAAPLPSPAVRNAAPAATPTAAKDVAPAVKRQTTKPVVRKPPPPAHPKRADKMPVTKTPTTPAPGEAPSTGQDVVSLRQEGISFPYPEYLRNIENQIFARWDHTMFRPGFDAKIAFVILKDGSVDPKSIEIVKGSGNYSFNLSAHGAIDAAAVARAFGPLPSGFNGGSLPILFDFTQVGKGAP